MQKKVLTSKLPLQRKPSVRPASRSAAPATDTTSLMLYLQRTVGNQAVNQLIQRYSLAQRATGQAPTGSEEELEDEDSSIVQGKAVVGLEGGPVPPSLAGRIRSAIGGGAPIANETRVQMESALGEDLSGVRVHTGREADSLNRSLGAIAFTTGSDIFFRDGAYRPGDSAGNKLLAHELTHVVQQRSMNASGPMTVGPSDDQYEREADSVSSALAQRATDDNDEDE